MSFTSNATTPARVKAARTVVTGITTAAVGTGLAVAGAGTANASDSVWDRVAQCESGGNWSINTGNGFHGGLQFTPSTWRAYGGSGSAANASRAEQIRVAKRVLASQGPGAWPVCSRKAGLTRGNGGSASAVESTSRKTTSVSRSQSRHTLSAKTQTPRVTRHQAAQTEAPAARHTARRTYVSAAPVAQASVVAPSLRTQIRSIQRDLGVSADGIIGPVTTRAIQKYVGVEQDGIIGRVTVRAIEDKTGLKHSGAKHLRTSRINALAATLNK